MGVESKSNEESSLEDAKVKPKAAAKGLKEKLISKASEKAEEEVVIENAVSVVA